MVPEGCLTVTSLHCFTQKKIETTLFFEESRSKPIYTFTVPVCISRSIVFWGVLFYSLLEVLPVLFT